MRKPIIAGNWKMNKTVGEAVELVKNLKPLVVDTPAEVVVCPPFTALWEVARILEDSEIALGAQNLFWETSGAYTGQISPLMLTDIGCKYVIIGHSETRGRFGKPPSWLTEEVGRYFGENDATVNLKVHSAFNNGLLPIVCVGETLMEREEGRTDQVVSVQTRRALEGLNPSQVEQIILAYEPVWAIGTGQVCDAREANRVCGLIREVILDLFGKKAASSVRIQYGGSVTPDNAKELIDQEHIDGCLVGGASLKAESFAQICAVARWAPPYG